MASIQVSCLHKRFDDFVAVVESNFTIQHGEFFVLLGPSGCGKTTTLRMMAGLELPSSGKILLDNQDVTFERAARRDIAFVFQLFALYPHMNVRENIGFPLKCSGAPRSEIRTRVAETAALLRIDHLLEQPVSALAGGDRQRVALGRAIVRRPKAFLMDEPLGTLDAEFRDLMINELRALHDRIDATTVYVTHDQLEAMAMADRIAIMNKGVMEQLGPPQEVYDKPASVFVADFIGSPPMSFLKFHGSLRPGDDSMGFNGSRCVTVPIPQVHEGYSEEDFLLGVRPEHVRFDDASGLRGQVAGCEYLGTTQIVTVDTSYGVLKARTPSSEVVQVGDNVGLRFFTERLSIFRSSTGRAVRTALHDN
jgi:multiple sugar transport system ATP-binding protein